MSERDGNVDIHLRAHAEGVRQGAADAKDTLRDLKEDVVRRGAEMAGISTDLAASVARVGTAFLGVGAAAYVTWKAYSDGKGEIREMNLAIAKTGEYSGQSAASLRALAGEMAVTSTLTVGEAKSIETALAASGQIGAAAFRSVSLVAGDFARVMGTDVAKVGPELVKIFDDPAKGAAELNRTMHFLSAAELDHIEHLVRMGEVTQAQVVLGGKLSDRLKAIPTELGLIESALKTGSKAWSAFWDAAMGVGRPATLEDKLAQVLKEIRSGAGRTLMSNADPERMRQAMDLERQINAAAAKRYDDSDKAEQDARDINVQKGLRHSVSKKVRDLRDQIQNVQKATGIPEDWRNEEVSGLQKEIDALLNPKAKAAKADRYRRDFDPEGDLEFAIREKAFQDGKRRAIESEREAERERTAAEERTRAAGRITQGLGADYRKTDESRQRLAEAAQMTESQRRLADALYEVDSKARAAREALDLRFKEREKDSQEYRAAVADIEAKQVTAAASARAWATEQDRLNTSWEVGAVRGLKAYSEEASRTADNVASSFRRGAQMAEDALANFVVKGKLDIRSLAEFAAVELARQNIARPLISAGSGWLQGLLSFGSSTAEGFGGDAGLAAAASIGGFASGGDHAGGWRIVGERGPELEATGPSRIFNATQTRDILAGAGGGAQNIRVEVVNPPGRAAEVASATPRIDIDGTVLRIVMREMEPGGRIARQQERQYGLNAAAGVVR